MKISGVLFLFLSAAFLLLCSADRPAAAEAAGPLAVIGDRKITPADFSGELEKRRGSLPAGYPTPEQREALFEDMVKSELLYAAALREGYGQRPDILAAVRQLLGSRYREEMLGRELAGLTVSEEEIRTYYAAHAGEFGTPPGVRAAVIRITVPDKAGGEKRAQLYRRAEEARAEALRPGSGDPSFGPVAVKYSDDQPTRYRGGDLGLLRKNDTPSRLEREVAEVIFSLAAPGEISNIITAPGGYYLVRLMEKLPARSGTLDEVRELVRSRLHGEKQVAAERAFYEKLGSSLNMKTDKALLHSIVAPQSPDRTGPPPLPGRRR